MYNAVMVEIENFGSHKKTLVSMANNECYMILGNNIDDKDEADSNGSGKSWIYRAITKGTYNKLSETFTKDDVVSNWAKEAYLKVSWFGDDLFEIERIIKRKGSDECKIYVNNKEVDTVDKDQFIEDKLGISYQDFINYFCVPQDSQFSFFSSGDAYIKKLISRFTDTDFLDGMREDAKGDLSDAKEELNDIREKILKTEQKLETLNEGKDKLVDILKRDADEEIAFRKSDIEVLKNGIESNEKSLVPINKSISDIEEKIKKEKKSLAVIDIKETKEQIRKLREDIDLIKEGINSVKGDITQHEVALKNLVTCPSCEHEFSVSLDKPIATIKKELQNLEKLKEQKIKDALKKSEEREALQDKIDENEIIEERISDLEQDLSIEKANKDSIQSQIDKKRDKITENKEVIQKTKELIESGFKSHLKEHEDEVKLVAKDLNKTQMIAKIKQSNHDKLNYWVSKGFDSFRSYLANMVLKRLEGKTNKYLMDYGSNITIKLNGYTVNKSGDLRDKISVKVFKNGEEMGSYIKLSGGQRKRVNIAGSLAIQDLINENLIDSNQGGIDVLILDEPFDGLDETGMKLASDLLNQLPKTVSFTSHLANDVIQVDNVIRVTMEDKVSTIDE